VPEMRSTPSSPERAWQEIPLLATKLHVPPPRTNLVARPRLLAALDEGLGQRLILVAAPAGFGKTTLLSQWVATRGLRCAWLSLDAADNDPIRLCTYTIGALQRIVPGAGGAAEPWLHAPQPPPVESILTPLINDLYALPEDVVLVLDDYHTIDAGAVHDAISYLLDQCPPPLHVVVATRADPPLPLARWRARGQMAEVRTDDLRFTSDEIALFCDQMTDARLAEEDLLALETRTEGWAVGLQMAALSMQGRADATSFIRSFSGSHRYVLDYLVEEVLDRQPEEVQAFLLRTSILERLCGALCDAVLEQEGSQAMLEQLDKANLFMVALDDERRWYRYHHLFAELLRAQLGKSLAAPGTTGLHVRAAEWHARHGSIQQAIHHASAASDDERLERFIGQHYLELVSRGEQSWLRSWTDSLSRELAHRRPWLCIYEAYSHSWFGELDEADRLLEEAEKRMRSESPTPDAPSMQALFAYVKSRVTAMRGDIDRAIEFCLEARELAPSSNLALQLDTRITLGTEYFVGGDYAHARPTLEEVVRAGGDAGAVINPVAASCILARLYAVQGRLHQSYDTYQVAAQLIPDASGQHRGPRALVEIGLAEVSCEWNDLDTALVHVQRGLSLMPFWDKADDWVLAYCTLARIHLARGNPGGAAKAVENAIHTLQARGVFPEARRAAEVAQVRLWLAQGDLPAADRWAASQEDRLGFERELAHIARARVWIAQNKPDEAIALLSHLEQEARSAGRMSRVIEILLLEALAQHEMGDAAHAIRALARCMSLAEPEGYARILLDEGAPMAELLQAGSRRGAWHEPRLAAYANRLLAASEAWTPPVGEREPTAAASGPAAMIEALTERELEVLRMVVEGRSNQEIAERLIIALGTVKAHVHHIYGKLEVSGRVQAIVRARELDLL
jgi:LuxR family maltose regulon positive regulatory protein